MAVTLTVDALYAAVAQGGTLPAAPHLLRTRWDGLRAAVVEMVGELRAQRTGGRAERGGREAGRMAR